MNSNLRQKFFTGAMILLATVFFTPTFAGAFTSDNYRPDYEKASRVTFENLAEPEND